jgi:hypothetical protein
MVAAGPRSIGAQEASSVPTAAQLFAQYRQGEFAGVAAALERIGDFAAFRRDLSSAIAHEPRELAAAFEIEAASAAYETPLARGGDIVDRVRAGRALIEESCALVRQLPPGTEFERRWQLVSLALLEGEDPRLGLSLNPPIYDGHWRHLRDRGADAGTLALSKGVNREQPIGRFFTDSGFGVGELSDSSDARARSVHQGQVIVREAMSALSDARKFSNVAVEATVRLGFVATANQRLNAALGNTSPSTHALALLSDIDAQTADARLRYLGHIFLGREYELNHNAAAAAAEYRRATDAIPAQSAMVSLASLLYLSGHGLDAGEMIHTVTSRTSAPDDPWLDYFSGASRELPARLAKMREVLR